MAPDITESIQWVRLVLLFADISFASSLPLVVFESDANKSDSDPQLFFMLHENNSENNPHTRSPPIDSVTLPLTVSAQEQTHHMLTALPLALQSVLKGLPVLMHIQRLHLTPVRAWYRYEGS